MTTPINEWAGRMSAEQSRQWPIIAEICHRTDAVSALEGLIVIGSFATGDVDDLSDIDLIAVAAPDCFDDAWEKRTRLRAENTLVAWDSHAAPSCRAHKWLTPDLVKVECVIVDPAAGGMKLADPCAVLMGDESLIERFPRIPPIPDDALQEYAEQIRSDGLVPDVETKYGEMKTAVRRALADS